ncbi:hypothetical protein ACN9MB_12965 [Dyella kyungheensis]|uniref:hypothetical protein n=1 Tax=Dyella kyungheensis TaxID=1242174 RepID=UPI003CF132B3
MTASRETTQILLNKLVVQLPRLRRENPDPVDFLCELAGLADVIVDGAAPEDFDWAVTSVEAMLIAPGAPAPR